jgi:hypothetical protein
VNFSSTQSLQNISKPLKTTHTNLDNLENEEDAAILLSMCTSSPQLDVSIVCNIDAEAEGCGAIAWNIEEDSEDDCDSHDDWFTESDQESESDERSASSPSDDGEEQEISSSSVGSDLNNGSSQVSGDNASDSIGADDDDSIGTDDDDCPQYCFEVDRNKLLESSLNSLKDMSKHVTCAKIITASVNILQVRCNLYVVRIFQRRRRHRRWRTDQVLSYVGECGVRCEEFMCVVPEVVLFHPSTFQVLDRLIAPGLLFIPVIVNQQIAYLRINPSPYALHQPPDGSSDPLYTRTDECLKLLGVAIAHSVALGNFCCLDIHHPSIVFDVSSFLINIFIHFATIAFRAEILVVSRLSCQLQVHFNFCFLQGIFVA